MTVHNIDATNQSLGRLASRIALILRGKINSDYRPDMMPQERVVVENISNIKLTGKKIDQKIYYHYSGYPGGMKERKLNNMMAQNPRRVLELAVYRMLAPNRLRARIMKNLEIK